MATHQGLRWVHAYRLVLAQVPHGTCARTSAYLIEDTDVLKRLREKYRIEQGTISVQGSRQCLPILSQHVSLTNIGHLPQISSQPSDGSETICSRWSVFTRETCWPNIGLARDSHIPPHLPIITLQQPANVNQSSLNHVR